MLSFVPAQNTRREHRPAATDLSAFLRKCFFVLFVLTVPSALFAKEEETVSACFWKPLPAQKVVSNLASAAKDFFPGTKQEFEIRFSVEPGGKADEPETEIRLGRLHVLLPENGDWRFDPEKVVRLARCFLLVRAGKTPDEEKLYPQNWFTDALARRASMNGTGSPHGGNGYPAAHAMASAGKYPSLRSLIRSELRPSDGPSAYAVHAEWADVLLEICLQAGAFRLDAARQYFLALPRMKTPEEKEKLFMKTFYSAMRTGGLPPENFFRSAAERLLLNRLMPLPARRMEYLYRGALAEAGGKFILSAIELFPEDPKEKITPLGSALLIKRMTELLYKTPPGTETAFRKLLGILHRNLLVEKPDKERLREAEICFLDRLALYALAEKKLIESERKFFSSGRRFSRTFESISASDAGNMLMTPLRDAAPGGRVP